MKDFFPLRCVPQSIRYCLYPTVHRAERGGSQLGLGRERESAFSTAGQSKPSQANQYVLVLNLPKCPCFLPAVNRELTGQQQNYPLASGQTGQGPSLRAH